MTWSKKYPFLPALILVPLYSSLFTNRHLYCFIHSKHFLQLIPKLSQTRIGNDLHNWQRLRETAPNCLSAATSVI